MVKLLKVEGSEYTCDEESNVPTGVDWAQTDIPPRGRPRPGSRVFEVPVSW